MKTKFVPLGLVSLLPTFTAVAQTPPLAPQPVSVRAAGVPGSVGWSIVLAETIRLRERASARGRNRGKILSLVGADTLSAPRPNTPQLHRYRSMCATKGRAAYP